MKTRVLKIKYIGRKEDIEIEIYELRKRENVISQSQFIPNQGGEGFVCFLDVLKEEVTS
jgi:hypothetical protein